MRRAAIHGRQDIAGPRMPGAEGLAISARPAEQLPWPDTRTVRTCAARIAAAQHHINQTALSSSATVVNLWMP